MDALVRAYPGSAFAMSFVHHCSSGQAKREPGYAATELTAGLGQNGLPPIRSMRIEAEGQPVRSLSASSYTTDQVERLVCP
jgi:hypothetical protein